MAIATTNPATGETIREFDELTDEQVQQKLQNAADAFRSYRTTGYADCKQYQYVFVGSEYFDQNNKHLFSTMFPVPRYAWKWQPVNEDSVAHAMMKVICEAAGAASQNN